MIGDENAAPCSEQTGSTRPRLLAGAQTYSIWATVQGEA